MSTRNFSGSLAELLPEIEKFRELQAFCSHDLRSQVGAVAGLLALLEDQLEALGDKTKSSFAAALTSAQESLAALDACLDDTRPHFESAWLIGFSDDEIARMGLTARLSARRLARPKPLLFLSFTTPDEWQPRVKKYRPLAVIFKDGAALGADAGLWVNRLGPHLTKIYLSQGPVPHGVRNEAVALLDAPDDLGVIAGQILAAIEGLPHGRN